MRPVFNPNQVRPNVKNCNTSKNIITPVKWNGYPPVQGVMCAYCECLFEPDNYSQSIPVLSAITILNDSPLFHHSVIRKDVAAGDKAGDL